MPILTDEENMKLTVAELIVKLEAMPQDMQVAMSSDEEGNAYYESITPEVENNVVILYPSGPQNEIDELQDFVEDEE